MNSFENETFNFFLSSFYDNYINHLIDSNAVDFRITANMDFNQIPFDVYNRIYCALVLKLNEENDYSNLLRNIFYNAYLYTYFSEDEDSTKIRINLENNSIDEEINNFNSPLYGTMLVKYFINYLLLINEDMAYKDILEEEARKNKQGKTLKKYSYRPIYTTRNKLLKDILYEIYTYYKEKDVSEIELFELIDGYFTNGTIPSSVFLKYQAFIEETDIDVLQAEQIRLMFETVYIGLINNHFETDEAKKMMDLIKNNDQLLLNDKHFRYILYAMFILEKDLFNPQELKELTSEEKRVLKKIYPAYFLDFLDSSADWLVVKKHNLSTIISVLYFFSLSSEL